MTSERQLRRVKRKVRSDVKIITLRAKGILRPILKKIFKI